MLYEPRVCNNNKRMLIAQDCVKFCGRFAWQVGLDFLQVKLVCLFPGLSAGKKKQNFVQSLVVFGISNISH